jgi:5-(hydroxymethyl)furfural/furfural oxidase
VSGRIPGSSSGTTTGADVVIVGAGSAGAPLAARLSEDPGREVLLLEAGPDYRSAATPGEILSANFVRALALRAFHWHALQARFTDFQAPRSYACGRGVGGSSAINGQMAVRGLPEDYQAWARAGCVGWGWQDVLPTFIALEMDKDYGARPYHGSGGPLPISRVPLADWAAVSEALQASATGLGHLATEDLNAPGATGASAIPANRRAGRRVSTNDAYLEPSRERPNLRIQPHVLVDRIIFSGSRAVGLVVRTPNGEQMLEAGEVALCAGAIYSPAILMRSGVGPADELRAQGIEVVADVPGVGRGLVDHPMATITFPLSPSVQGTSRDAVPGSCLVRLSSQISESPLDDIEVLALDHGLNPSSAGLLVALMYPFSVGSVKLQARDPRTDPVVELCMLSDERDITRLGNAIRHAAILLGEPAFRGVAEGRGRLAPTRQIDDCTDAQLHDWLRSAAFAHNHPVGTCRMGSVAEPGTVVDPAGRVVGLGSLRVIDASVLPGVVRAPTHLTTVMIAERIAEKIRGVVDNGL